MIVRAVIAVRVIMPRVVAILRMIVAVIVRAVIAVRVIMPRVVAILRMFVAAPAGAGLKARPLCGDTALFGVSVHRDVAVVGMVRVRMLRDVAVVGMVRACECSATSQWSPWS